jgi:multimeric flavodoxin WrbA
MSKILIINGSPHKNGSCSKVIEVIKQEIGNDIEIEDVFIGNKITSCIGCGWCSKNGKCVFDDDLVNEIGAKLEQFDGFIYISPVHYAAISGAMNAFLSRLYYSHGKKMIRKPVANFVVCRRGGSTAALDELNKYPTINQQPIVSGTYWNGIHGQKNDEVLEDAEGIYNVRQVSRNLVWLIKAISNTQSDYTPEITDPKPWTNFIR